jgi:transposase InsO family protein
MIRSTTEQLEEMKQLCRTFGRELRLLPGEPEGAPLLFALFLGEHYNPANPNPRIEKAYCPGGRYFNAELWGKFGEDSAKSFSNWQIMFPVAWELGFRGVPADLDNDTIAVRWVVELLNQRILRLSRKDDGVATLREILDAYNSGNPHDANVPEQYIERGEQNYAKAKTLLGG